MRGLILCLAVILVIVFGVVLIARSQSSHPPAAGSEVVTFSEDSSGCRWRIYGSDRGLEVIRSEMRCAVFISAWDEAL